MLRIILSITLATISSSLFAQDTTYVHVNTGVDVQNEDIKSIIELWKNYLHSNPDGLTNSPYWNEEEKAAYKNFDFLSFEFGRQWYNRPYYKSTILSIDPVNEYFQIKALFAYVLDTGNIEVLCSMNVYAKKENGQFKLYNSLPIYTQDWQHKKTRSIQYHYLASHEFNTALADSMNIFIDDLKVKFEIDTTYAVAFYFADDWDVIQQAKGLDYYAGMGNIPKPQGRQNGLNKMVFSGAGSEWYPHELAHIYLYPEFPKGGFFHEGIASLLGGHAGKLLEWHYKRMDSYLTEHPEINLDSLMDFYYMDNITNPKHVISGLLCQMALESGGMDKLKQLLTYGGSHQNYSFNGNAYNAIEDVLGIKQENLNEIIRQELKDRAPANK